MAEPLKPTLQKPPGYRDPTIPAKPMPRPLPRKPVLPTSFRRKSKRRNYCRTCCCFVFVFILILIIVLTIAGGIFYIWFEPKLPVFHLQSFRIPRFNVTVKPDGTYLDAQTVTRVEVKNPNGKLALYYGTTSIDITVGGETELGSKEVGGFVQAKKNATSVKVATAVKSQLVDDGSGTKLKNGYRSKDLMVNVEAKTHLGYIVQGWKIGTVGVNVHCGGRRLRKLDNGDMPRCTVNILKWYSTFLSFFFNFLCKSASLIDAQTKLIPDVYF
ncbi:hypothetical protein UlMin_021645 [Ulmus minor]